MRTASILVLLLPALVCAQDKKPEPIKVIALERKDPVLFDKDIEPMLAKKCTVCHSGNVMESRLDLGSYEGLMAGGRRGKSVVPGKSGDSLMVKAGGRTDKPLMPPKNETPFTPEELALLKLWIDQGAKAPASVRQRPAVTLSAPTVTPVRAVAVSPDKNLVAAGRGNQIHIYDAKTGNYLRSLFQKDLAGAGKPVEAAHLSLVESLAFAPDGKLLASGSYKEVLLWDPHAARMEKKIEGFADRVVALAFAPDGKRLATGGGPPSEDGEVKVFEVPEGKLVMDAKESKNGHSDTVYGVCFSPDGKHLASAAADKFVKVFEVPGNKLVKSLEGHTQHVLDVGWKSDGKLLASAGADNVIKVWDFDKGEQTRTIPGSGKQLTRIVFVGKTSQVLTCGGDVIRLSNVDNGARVRDYADGSDFLYAVAASADGAIVVAGGEEGVVRLFNGANGQLQKRLTPPAPGTAAANPGAPPTTTTPPPSPAGETKILALIGESSAGWKFLPAGNVSGDAWRTLDFDDKKWRTGKAPIGYGEEEIDQRKGTTVADKGVPFIFRRAIELPEEALKSKDVVFKLNVASDDSATVYVNGQVVDEDSEDHEFMYWNRSLEVPANLFKPGKNVVAVQVKNGAGSSDIYLDMDLSVRWTAGKPKK